MKRILLSILIAGCFCIAASSQQQPNNQASISLKGKQGRDEQVKVAQGKEVEVVVKVLPAPNKDGAVDVIASSSESGCTRGCQADSQVDVPAGQTEVKTKILLPLDAQLGEWTVNRANFRVITIPGWDRLELKDTPTFSVTKGEGPDIITPKTASVEVEESK